MDLASLKVTRAGPSIAARPETSWPWAPTGHWAGVGAVYEFRNNLHGAREAYCCQGIEAPTPVVELQADLILLIQHCPARPLLHVCNSSEPEAHSGCRRSKAPAASCPSLRFPCLNCKSTDSRPRERSLVLQAIRAGRPGRPLTIYIYILAKFKIGVRKHHANLGREVSTWVRDAGTGR